MIKVSGSYLSSIYVDMIQYMIFFLDVEFNPSFIFLSASYLMLEVGITVEPKFSCSKSLRDLIV